MPDLATIWEAIADLDPDADALAHGDVATGGPPRSWGTMQDRAARLAAAFAAHGVGADDKVGLYLYNGPEYLEAEFAAFKQRAVPCNVNYRYLADELTYLLTNADARVLVFDHTLAERVLEVRGRCPDLRLLVQVGGDEVVEGAEGYEDLIAAHEPAPRITRSDDDLWFLYTGGTTGHPKAVMWPHSSLLQTMAVHYGVLERPVPSTVEEAVDAVREFRSRGREIRLLAAAPLMHGTSGISSLQNLTLGGMIATLAGRHFDAHELWRVVQERRITQLTIVGDAFARPMLAALDEAAAEGRPYDLSSLHQILSSGVMWSNESKQALLAHHDMTLFDSLGSSEGVGFGAQIARRGEGETRTARFRLGPNATVLTDDGRQVEPGSGEVGMLAVGGPIPLGYYKDPEKTAATFREVGGRRWSMPGDFATIEADGTITLLGRGSVCINSGGEKIYPEEVEEALKTHPAVRDANVVGLPDEKWGQAVTAVVSLEPGAEVTDDELVGHVKSRIAHYKAPKTIVRVAEVLRGPNGKADYRWARDTAARAVGV